MEQGGGERTSQRKRIEWNNVSLVVDVGGCSTHANVNTKQQKMGEH